MEGFFLVRRGHNTKYYRICLALLLSLLVLTACQSGRHSPPGASGQSSSVPQSSVGSDSAPELSDNVSLPPAASASAPGQEPRPPASANHTLYILMYHDFVEGGGEGLNDWTLTADRFREDLQWLADHGYTTVLPSELAAGAPLPEKAVMLTFDDGYASNYALAYPLLQEFQAKAVISLIVHHIDDGDPGWLTWDMCREMAQSGLVELGSHTYKNHASEHGIQRIKGETQDAYQERIFPDLQKSVDLIEEHIEADVPFFAYPHGAVEPWAGDFLAEHFAVSVTTQHGPADITGGLYDMPRHNIAMSTPLSKYLPA